MSTVTEADVRAVLTAIQELPDDFPDFVYGEPFGPSRAEGRAEAEARVDERNMTTLRGILEDVFGARVLPRLRLDCPRFPVAAAVPVSSEQGDQE